MKNPGTGWLSLTARNSPVTPAMGAGGFGCFHDLQRAIHSVTQDGAQRREGFLASMLQPRLTFRYSTGLVTLNLSIVVMMMAGVVRKKRRMKSTTLITRQRIHQMKPRMERCSLQAEEGTKPSEERIAGRAEDPGPHARDVVLCWAEP